MRWRYDLVRKCGQLSLPWSSRGRSSAVVLYKNVLSAKALTEVKQKKRHELCLTEKKEAKILFFFKTGPENKFKVIRGN